MSSPKLQLFHEFSKLQTLPRVPPNYRLFHEFPEITDSSTSSPKLQTLPRVPRNCTLPRVPQKCKLFHEFGPESANSFVSSPKVQTLPRVPRNCELFHEFTEAANSFTSSPCDHWSRSPRSPAILSLIPQHWRRGTLAMPIFFPFESPFLFDSLVRFV